ncbi:MAG: hypothetical protein QNK30_14005 [Bacteroidales bacterium]|nr:hypothetical protein [Bacteroidales bacterium]
MDRRLLFLSFVIIFSASCNKEESKPLDTGFLHGVFVVNEGGYASNNGSITYIDTDSSLIYYNLFEQVNNRSTGDVIQSFTVFEDMGFIVANNSQKVEVVDLETFASIGTVLGADYPRYFLGISNNKGYLSDGAFNGNILVIDLTTFMISGQIVVGNGPENMVQSGDLVFVANSGGWTSDSTVSVINSLDDLVVKTLKVGDNPTDMVVDANGKVWVLCKGKVSYDQNWNVIGETSSRLMQINPNDYSITKDFEIGIKGDFFNPVRIAISKDGNTIYYVEAEGIYKHTVSDANTSNQVYIKGSFYGLDLDPKEGIIYALKANGFDADGYLYRYEESGTLVDSIKVGIGPNGANFN